MFSLPELSSFQLQTLLQASQPYSIGPALFMAYAGGLLASLSPCSYPLLPITVSFMSSLLSSDEKKQSWKSGLYHGLIYASGMALFYATLGTLAALSGKLFGFWVKSFEWNLGMGIIMTLAALVQLNVLPLPNFQLFGTPLLKGSTYSSWNAFLFGLTSGCIASPCITPILSVILSQIAHARSVGLGFLLMLSFAYGLSTLFLCFITFSKAVPFLPRSGPWMQRLQTLGGLILLGFAEYLIYNAGHA